MMLRDGEPCKHPGCLNHLSHPCEGCGRIGGRTPKEFKRWKSPDGKEYFIGIDVALGDDQSFSAAHNDGIPEQLCGLEPSTWPTYGGVTRSANPEAANWKFSAGDPTVLTLKKLTTMLEALPKMPKFPPYYRAHPITMSAMSAYLPRYEDIPAIFNSVEIREDPTVPIGEFLPPEGWEP